MNSLYKNNNNSNNRLLFHRNRNTSSSTNSNSNNNSNNKSRNGGGGGGGVRRNFGFFTVFVFVAVITLIPFIGFYNYSYYKNNNINTNDSDKLLRRRIAATAAAAEDSDSTTTTTTTKTNTGGGFHPIYVYHGPENSINNLQSSSSEMKQNYKRGSQVDQDKIIVALTTKLYNSLLDNNNNNNNNNNKKDYYFIDLAANDAIQLSNTLYLEEKGWTGLCIEPNPIYWYRLAHRKCDVAGTFVGGKNDMEQVDVSLTNEEYGGIVSDGMDNMKKKTTTTEKRYTISMNTLFRTFQVPKIIDYMSLDVEGAEELIMGDFPFNSYQVRFLTVERPKPKLQSILKSNGYKFVMLLVYWGETLWVHEDSVLSIMSIQDIISTVKSTSKHTERRPKHGQLTFNIETGEYHRI